MIGQQHGKGILALLGGVAAVVVITLFAVMPWDRLVGRHAESPQDDPPKPQAGTNAPATPVTPETRVAGRPDPTQTQARSEPAPAASAAAAAQPTPTGPSADTTSAIAPAFDVIRVDASALTMALSTRGRGAHSAPSGGSPTSARRASGTSGGRGPCSSRHRPRPLPTSRRRPVGRPLASRGQTGIRLPFA